MSFRCVKPGTRIGANIIQKELDAAGQRSTRGYMKRTVLAILLLRMGLSEWFLRKAESLLGARMPRCRNAVS